MNPFAIISVTLGLIVCVGAVLIFAYQSPVLMCISVSFVLGFFGENDL